MASRTQWTWVWVDSRSQWWTGRPGMLQFMGSQRVGTTEQLNWTELNILFSKWMVIQSQYLIVLELILNTGYFLSDMLIRNAPGCQCSFQLWNKTSSHFSRVQIILMEAQPETVRQDLKQSAGIICKYFSLKIFSSLCNRNELNFEVDMKLQLWYVISNFKFLY